MKKSDERYFLEVNVKYPEELLELHNCLPFLSEKIKIEKLEKLVANLHVENEYVIHINSKQALNNGLVLNKVHIIIKFNQKSFVKTIHWYEYWAKKKAKNDFEKKNFPVKSWKMWKKQKQKSKKELISVWIILLFNKMF